MGRAGCRFNATPLQCSFALATRIRHGGSFLVVAGHVDQCTSGSPRDHLFAQGAAYCAVCAPLEVGAGIKPRSRFATAPLVKRNARLRRALGLTGRPNPRSCPQGATSPARDACPCPGLWDTRGVIDTDRRVRPAWLRLRSRGASASTLRSRSAWRLMQPCGGC